MPILHLKIKKKKLFGSIEGEIVIEANTVKELLEINKDAKLNVS